MKLDYQLFGTKENFPILLIHPFPFDARFWEITAKKLSEKYFVITPSLRGCGQSSLGSQEPDLFLLAQDIEELLNELEIRKVVLGGISLGGYVAMALAKINPKLISGLVLLDTKASQDAENVRENRIKMASQMREFGREELFAKQMANNLVSEFTKKNNPETVHQIETWISQANSETIAWLQIAMADRSESFTTLEKLNVPTLLIRGEHDLISSEEDFEQIRNKMRQVTYVEISNAGHLPPVEDSIATHDAIEKWLSTFEVN